MKTKQPIWTPGCGRPHPDIELIKAWAEGKVMLVDKQRVTDDGRKYGEPVKAQYPCWNPDGWTFDVARNSQMVLDLTEALVSTRKEPTLRRKSTGQKWPDPCSPY